MSSIRPIALGVLLSTATLAACQRRAVDSVRSVAGDVYCISRGKR